MGFRTGAYAKIWKLEDKGKYAVAQMSTSHKDKVSGEYVTDWKNGFVRLVGNAKNVKEGDTVRIGDCDVTNNYDREKNITYTNYTIFSLAESNGNTAQSAPKKQDDSFVKVPDTAADTSELPFN